MVSGIKPTGKISIGNYLGAIKQFIKYQDEYDLYVLSESLNPYTVIPITNSFPLDEVIVISALPSVIAFTKPVLSTVATAVLFEAYENDKLSTAFPKYDGSNCNVSLAFNTPV